MSRPSKYPRLTVGEVVGRLEVLEVGLPSPKYGLGEHCRCLCLCGVTKIIYWQQIRTGLVTSCGCLLNEARSKAGKASRKHGESHYRLTPEYLTWRSMRRRCNNATRHDYRRYGGRGITVCERWNNSYEAFLEDVGRRPSSLHSLDRIDYNGNYEPSNVRWASAKEQQRNRSSNRLITAFGETYCMSEWAERKGINRKVLRARLEMGWSPEDALTRPIRSTSSNSDQVSHRHDQESAA